MFPDQKYRALHKLTQDEDGSVRGNAAVALGTAFNHIPDKAQAWQDLHRLIQDKDGSVRGRAANALGKTFSHIPDETQAWQDLYGLTHDENNDVRFSAANALGTAFGQVTDKTQAWQDLHRLAQNECSDARFSAAIALEMAFSQVPDKVQAWQDLHRLTQDEDDSVRGRAANSLGTAFSQVTDKTQAWQDLHRLTQDPNKDTRMYAYHSLGKASIFRATTSAEDETFRENLNNAIEFFEKSAHEATYYNPAQFCIPFYRSFLAVAFQDVGSQEQVDMYLAMAKDAIAGSKSRELLLKAVENLSRALREAQKSNELHETQAVLEACRPYCDRAEELLDKTEDMAPGASGVVRRGLPIISRKIKTILKEIEESSSRLREGAKKTPFEPITTRTDKKIKGLSGVEFGFNAESIMNEVVPDIRVMCSFLPDRSKESVCELKNWDSLDFENKAILFKRAIIKCTNQMENLYNQIGDKDDQINYLKNEILARLDNINFHVFKISIRSADTAQSLRVLEYELQKIKKIKDDLDRLGQTVDDLGIYQRQALQELQKSAPSLIRELKEIVKEKENLNDPETAKVPDSWWQKPLNKLNTFDESPSRIAIGLAADLLQIISFILPPIP